MTMFMRILLVLIKLFLVENSIYLYNTEDSPSLEFYDCIYHRSHFYCRRPKEPIPLQRDHVSWRCYHDGIRHSFSSLRANNTNTSIVLHNWKSSVEIAEQYSRYLRQPINNEEKFLCQCTTRGSFGKFCEYLLLVGETFNDTAQWEAEAKASYSHNMQIYGDTLCYTTLVCDSGLLCLDWRDICDGLQQCMSGYDEDNCDKLEFNECENDEYRCANGMCIPDEYFLDGDYDCMDLSDEMQMFDDVSCPKQEVSLRCDERICPPNQWSCGDGQCLENRLGFQRFSKVMVQCVSRREQYYMCETNSYHQLWTMPNGRCSGSKEYEEPNAKNRSLIRNCTYVLQCALSRGAEQNCPCNDELSCIDQLKQICGSDVIQYPAGGILAPYIFQFYNITDDWLENIPDFLQINATIKCRGNTIHRQITLPYPSEFNLRDIEKYLCIFTSNNSRNHFHHNDSHTFNNRSYNLFDVCDHSQGYISAYRINDGVQDCADGMDEKQKELVTQTCSNIKQYRFRCSSDQPTCLLVNTLGNFQSDCRNEQDESWFGTEKMLAEMNCNSQSNGDCKSIRHYVEASWLSDIDRDTNSKRYSAKAIPFRTYCDSFWNLGSRKDEDMQMCRNWWICPKEQWRCATGQCIDVNWVLDGEWDCSDASDEEGLFSSNHTLLERNLKLYNRLQLQRNFKLLYNIKPFGELCNLSVEYPCIRVNISGPLNRTTKDLFCISLKQIGDGQVDCLGGLDERNVLKHCDRATMLGDSFKCLTSDTCVDYSKTCDQACPHKSDDESLCHNEWNKHENCSEPRDFACLNGKCAEDSWCDKEHDCKFGEDEYMCDQHEATTRTPVRMVYRRKKELDIKSMVKKVQLPWFPRRTIQTKTVKMTHPISSSKQTITTSSELVSSAVPYTCNRGVGIQSYNRTIACFCPPEYYGDKCQFHSDRMLVLLHFNFSGSSYINSTKSTTVLKVLLVFLYENQTLLTSEFHVRPIVEIISYTKKIDHMLYSHSPHFIHSKRLRYSNRSSIIHEHPYSLRIETYELNVDEIPRLVAVWQYPIYFDYLPSFRFAKVLRLRKLNATSNPCASNPCGPSEECHQLLNQESSYVCLCNNNFTGERCFEPDPLCTAGFCQKNSVCKPYYRGVLAGNTLPYCVCPYNTFGRRCDLTYDSCALHSCQNNGTCFPSEKPNEHVCVCLSDYYGLHCESKRPFVDLYLNETVIHRGAVVQYFKIDFFSLDLILVQQNAYENLPNQLFYRPQTEIIPPQIILVKLYSETQKDIYLISMQWSKISINLTTQLIEENRCIHAHLLYKTTNETSVFIYHQYCINNQNLLCFHDADYLCICDEKNARAECFTYNNHLDHCSHCLNDGQCLRGDLSKKDDYICLCSLCHSGENCQFSFQLSMLNFDLFFVTDLQSNNLFVQRSVFYSLIIGSWILFLIGLVNNTASFFTFHRRKCRQTGIGQYLLYMSIVNQIVLGVLACRLTLLAINLTSTRFNPVIANAFCKLLPSLLGTSRHMTYWLTSLIAIERAYVTLYLNGQWLKKPHIARRFILFIFISTLGGNIIEFYFRASHARLNNQQGSICLLSFSSPWVQIYQIITVGSISLPLLINLCCTMTIICIVIKKKMNIITKHTYNLPVADVSSINLDELRIGKQPEPLNHGSSVNLQTHLHLLRDVLSENKELVIGPVFTLIPQLFSLPILIVSFSLICETIETSPLRYLLIASELTSFFPQVISFFLYISPSSFYLTEWRATNMSKHITVLTRCHRQSASTLSTILSITKSKSKHDLETTHTYR